MSNTLFFRVGNLEITFWPLLGVFRCHCLMCSSDWLVAILGRQIVSKFFPRLRQSVNVILIRRVLAAVQNISGRLLTGGSSLLMVQRTACGCIIEFGCVFFSVCQCWYRAKGPPAEVPIVGSIGNWRKILMHCNVCTSVRRFGTIAAFNDHRRGRQVVVRNFVNYLHLAWTRSTLRSIFSPKCHVVWSQKLQTISSPCVVAVRAA